MLSLSYFLACLAALATTPLYDIRETHDWLTMRDGTRLSVTYFTPVRRDSAETFPVLLEMLPYRKGDSFYLRDYWIYSYISRRGYIMAKVDVRGTGASEGHLPPREYSDAELNDAVEIIAQLARMPASNGRVGMWGKSWGGFNSLQVAMRRPPALKAILAMHASDDLFHDDVHYIDGALHVDPYALQIDHENGLPSTDGYPLDSAYFANRFDATPWIFTYLQHATDGEWWRQGSLRFHPERVQVPVYLIGGLLDGYRDTQLRLLESLHVPVKVDMGPWKHDYPNTAVPGPGYEWRDRAVRWWDHWLKGKDTGMLREPRLALFVRSGHPPNDTLTTTPGTWRFEDWPIARTRWRALYLAAGGVLADRRPARGVDSLRYRPEFGMAAGDWWGDPTGDMRGDDAGSLVYDTAPLQAAEEIAGFPRVALTVSAGAPLANWTIRLEDVAPDGAVSLVAGGAMNGPQLTSRLAPSRLIPGRRYPLAMDLHFTTWIFQKGHRIRLAVSNAQFPMLWPTPYPMTTTLDVGGDASVVIPVIPAARRPAPDFPPVQPTELPPDGKPIEPLAPSYRRVTAATGSSPARLALRAGDAYAIGNRTIQNDEAETYEVRPDRPADARFLGDESHTISIGDRVVLLRTRMDVTSDERFFHVVVRRTISENGRVVREREFADSVARDFH